MRVFTNSEGILASIENPSLSLLVVVRSNIGPIDMKGNGLTFVRLEFFCLLIVDKLDSSFLDTITTIIFCIRSLGVKLDSFLAIDISGVLDCDSD